MFREFFLHKLWPFGHELRLFLIRVETNGHILWIHKLQVRKVLLNRPQEDFYESFTLDND